MSMEERSGERDLTYSKWHRPSKITRFVSQRDASTLLQIDIDWCEYCWLCKNPLALVETQRSTQAPKSAAVTARLAGMAGIAAYSLSYAVTADGLDIEFIRVRQIVPKVSEVERLSPQEWADRLVTMRLEHERHECTDKRARRA